MEWVHPTEAINFSKLGTEPSYCENLDLNKYLYVIHRKILHAVLVCYKKF